jgi:two-component system, chemotaxis family, chemotaxis protein CheY
LSGFTQIPYADLQKDPTAAVVWAVKYSLPIMNRTSVYVVDDNDVVRRVLKGIIRQDDRLLYVGETTHGEPAVLAIDKLKPDVICLDIQMPGEVDGMGVLQHVREHSPATKVVMISGYATPESVKKARELGASGFLVKPFNADRVLRAIHAAIDTPGGA